MGCRVATTQLNYLPLRGWFELVASVDVPVYYDTVQFTKRNRRTRFPKWAVQRTGRLVLTRRGSAVQVLPRQQDQSRNQDSSPRGS
ncbi:uncharacterized protein METZ01_LOCUS395616, partial [marine metagenome]